jgi:hypothetical protein
LRVRPILRGPLEANQDWMQPFIKNLRVRPNSSPPTKPLPDGTPLSMVDTRASSSASAGARARAGRGGRGARAPKAPKTDRSADRAASPPSPRPRSPDAAADDRPPAGSAESTGAKRRRDACQPPVRSARPRLEAAMFELGSGSRVSLLDTEYESEPWTFPSLWIAAQRAARDTESVQTSTALPVPAPSRPKHPQPSVINTTESSLSPLVNEERRSSWDDGILESWNNLDAFVGDELWDLMRADCPAPLLDVQE